MARAWIEDRWLGTDKQPTAQDGKGARWRVLWWEDRVDDEGRPAKRRRSRSFGRKVDAEAYRTRVEDDLRSYVYRPPELAETPISEVAARWLRSLHDVRASTKARYEWELQAYVLPAFGARPVGALTRAEVSSWVDRLVEGTAPARFVDRNGAVTTTMRRGLSPRSVRHVFKVLAGVLGWAVDMDLVPRSVAAGIRLPKPADAEHVYLSHGQVEDLANAAEEASGRPVDRLIVLTLAYTGLRINEAFALEAGDVDAERRRLHVRHTWTKGAGGRPVLGPPKGGAARSVPLPAFLAAALGDLVAGVEPAAFLFQSSAGTAVNDHNWRARVFVRAVRGAGLEDRGLTPHKLRHTAASAAIGAGADVKVVQLMLGHADATETLNTYGHLWPDRLDEVADAMEAARIAELGASNVVPLAGARGAG